MSKESIKIGRSLTDQNEIKSDHSVAKASSDDKTLQRKNTTIKSKSHRKSSARSNGDKDREIRKLKSKVETLRKEADASSAFLTKALSAAVIRVDEIEKNYAAAETSWLSENEGLEEYITSLENKIASYEEEKKASATEMKRLLKKIKYLSDKLSEKEDAESTLDDAYMESEELRRHLNDSQSKWLAEKETLMSTIEELRELEKRRKAQETNEDQIAEQQDCLSNLEIFSHSKDMIAQDQDSPKEESTASSSVGTIESIMRCLTNEVDKLQCDSSSRKALVEETKNQIFELNANLEQLEASQLQLTLSENEIFCDTLNNRRKRGYIGCRRGVVSCSFLKFPFKFSPFA